MNSSTSITLASTAVTKAGKAARVRSIALLSILAGGLLASSAASAFVSSSVPASPTVVLFDFDPSTTNVAGLQLSTKLGVSSSSGLGKVAGPDAISAYMTAVLQASGYQNSKVTVTGALATATYRGEGYVWGNTLGTTDAGLADKPGATDRFLINDNFGIFGAASPEIKMQFTNFIVDSISYDWEIFPDVTCPTSTCKTLPDMSLTADGKSVPGGAFIANRHSGTSSDAGYAPQALGTISKPLVLNGASLLEFHDWPAEIGIDHLQITGHVVPEPASLPLLGAGMLAIGWLARRRRQA